MAKIVDKGAFQILDNMPAPNDNRPNLLDAQVVEDLVRSFAGHVIQLRRSYLKDPSQAIDAQGDCNKQSALFAALFLGKNPDYFAGDWNISGQIAQFVGAIYRLEGEPEQVLDAAFTRFYLDIAKASINYEAGKSSEDQAKFQLETSIETMKYALLGIDNA